MKCDNSWARKNYSWSEAFLRSNDIKYVSLHKIKSKLHTWPLSTVHRYFCLLFITVVSSDVMIHVNNTITDHTSSLIYSKTSISEHLLFWTRFRSYRAIFAGNASPIVEHLSVLNLNTVFPVPIAIIISFRWAYVIFFFLLFIVSDF